MELLSPLPGDVIQYVVDPHSAWSSKAVAMGEMWAGCGHGFEFYSHSTILSDQPGMQWEAKFPRTGHFPIDVTRTYEIWRVGNLDQHDRNNVLRWCKAHEGHLYNLTGVLTLGWIELPGTYYCSQFVGLAYKEVGLTIGDDIMSPDSLPDFPGARMITRYEPAR